MEREEQPDLLTPEWSPEAERRAGYDRRRLRLWTFVQGGVTPRRRGGRRAQEPYVFVDWHEPHLMFLALTILLLSMSDALLTITLMSKGAEEANPLLAYLLLEYPGLFAVVKMGLTAVGVLVLVALSRATVFRIIRVSSIIYWFLIAYVVLIGYEWWLLQIAL